MGLCYTCLSNLLRLFPKSHSSFPIFALYPLYKTRSYLALIRTLLLRFRSLLLQIYSFLDSCFFKVFSQVFGDNLGLGSKYLMFAPLSSQIREIFPTVQASHKCPFSLIHSKILTEVPFIIIPTFMYLGP